MNRDKLVARVRSLTRDLTRSIFREEDIVDFINEGIDRVMQIMPEFVDMAYLDTPESEPQYLPKAYHSLIAVFATSRCFAQDERNYQATTYMNEFETKMEELRIKVDEGEVKITSPDGDTVDMGNESFYVEDNYFDKSKGTSGSFDFPHDEDLDPTVGEHDIIDGGEEV